MSVRSVVANVNNWQQLQLRALMNQGWELPAEINLDYTQCLADSPGLARPDTGWMSPLDGARLFVGDSYVAQAP